jgi:hypothetical protein
MRELNGHKVNGLNEALRISVLDEPGSGGACHHYKIEPTDRKEEETMSTISKLVWVVIALLIITGTALFLSAPLDYLAKSKFIVKVIIFSVIVANGLLLNFWITPVLKKIVFGPVEKQPTFKIRFMRRVAFASGVVSMISWFAVFVLGSVRSIPVSIGWGTAIYSGILLLGILGSQFFATWMKYGTLLPNKD